MQVRFISTVIFMKYTQGNSIMALSVDYQTRFVKDAALRHGFMGAGIAKAEHMDEEAHRLEQWLAKGYHGEMGYMANHFDMRVDPARLVPGAKSVISLLYNYYPEEAKAGAKAKDEKMPDFSRKTQKVVDPVLTSHDSRL